MGLILIASRASSCQGEAPFSGFSALLALQPDQTDQTE